MNTPDSNKAVVRRFHTAFGTANATALREVLSKDFVMHGMPPELGNGVDGLVEMARQLKAGMSGCENTIEDLISAEEDKVVARFTTRAVHAGELFGAPPSGRRVTLTGIEVYRMSGGRIAELWGEYNMAELFAGASPS